MSRPATPSKSGAVQARSREDVMNLFDEFDNLDTVAPPPPSGSAGTHGKASSSHSGAASAAGKGDADDAQSVLDFLDDIVASRDKRASAALTSKKASTSSNGAAASGSSSAGAAGSNTSSTIPRSSSRTTLRDNAISTSVPSSTRSVNSPSTGRASYLQPGGRPATPASSATQQASGSSTATRSAEKQKATPATSAQARVDPEQPAAGGWGWGSVWGAASAVVQQARTVAEEQVSKNLPKNLPTSLPSPTAATERGTAAVSAATEQAARWRSGVFNMIQSMPSAVGVDVDKLRRDIAETGMKAFREVIDAVAPPIAEHEVIEVNLSHDMKGYEGVETLVYRALSKIMEQVEGGELVVNRGQSDDAATNEDDDGEERNLNTISGLHEGYKLAEANLEALIKQHYKKPDELLDAEAGGDKPKPSHGRSRSQSALTVPVTRCPVYMRIQAVMAPLPFALPAVAEKSDSTEDEAVAPAASSDDMDKQLYFILILRDPTNSLIHRTLTQAIPGSWLDIPFEDNEWVEDIMVDVIRRGVEIIGEEYIKGRMHGRLLKNVRDSNDDNVVFAAPDADAQEGDSSTSAADVAASAVM
ncbi:hypothetical protein EMMF5_001371 [Cystobasidiomycetes sp. EMM_F5]